MGFNEKLQPWEMAHFTENMEECLRSSFITPNTDGNFSVVCERLQTSVFSGTEMECREFIGIPEEKDYEEDNSMWDWPGF